MAAEAARSSVVLVTQRYPFYSKCWRHLVRGLPAFLMTVAAKFFVTRLLTWVLTLFSPFNSWRQMCSDLADRHHTGFQGMDSDGQTWDDSTLITFIYVEDTILPLGRMPDGLNPCSAATNASCWVWQLWKARRCHTVLFNRNTVFCFYQHDVTVKHPSRSSCRASR